MAISILAPLFLAMPAVSAFSISIFSSVENSGVLPGCTPMPMTSVSTMRAARAITSMCPLVTGSNEPEVKPMRFMSRGQTPRV